MAAQLNAKVNERACPVTAIDRLKPQAAITADGSWPTVICVLLPPQPGNAGRAALGESPASIN